MNQYISHLQLKTLIEPFIYNGLDGDKYKLRSVPARDLLTWNRLDLGFKLFYLKHINKHLPLSEEVYREDIRSQTLGEFKEPGNPQKDTFNAYIKTFDDIFNLIKDNGFDNKISLIPICRANSIINGAHRIAIAAFLNKTVDCVELNCPPLVCDFNYFLKRNVSREIIELAVNSLIDFGDNNYIAFLWPSGRNKVNESVHKFYNVVYQKDLQLELNGARNLLIELYHHMEWVGNIHDKYSGINKKLIECFPNNGPIRIIVFQCDNLSKVQKLKKEVRNINNIGYSSIHITDTKNEAKRIAKLVFNPNGLHFLNYSKHYHYPEKINELLNVKSQLSNRRIDHDTIVLDGGTVLSVYGQRKNNDIDYLSETNIDDTFHHLFDSNDDELKYHRSEKEHLIFNPRFHFEFRGLKFVSFEQVYSMKQRRRKIRDVNDCAVMKAYTQDDNNVLQWRLFLQYIHYQKLKFIHLLKKPVLMLLIKLDIYYETRSFYRKLKRM